MSVNVKEHKRCTECKKKIGLMEYKCKCGHLFCITHLQSEKHNCKYDYKLEGKERIKKELDIGQFTYKIVKI